MAFADVADLLQPIVNAASTYGDALVPLGRTLLAVAITLSAVPAVYDFWTGGGITEAIAKMVRAVLLLIIPLTLLTGSNWLTTTGALAGFFQKEVTAPLIARSPSAGGVASTDLVKGLINKVATGIWADGKPGGVAAPQSTWQKTLQFMRDPINNVAGAIFTGLTDILLRAILTLVGMVLMTAMLFALYGPILALQYGIVFGPILIVWIVFPPFADLARNWLKFMITHGLSLALGVLLSLIVSTSIGGFIDGLATLTADPSTDWMTALLAQIGAFGAAASVMMFISIQLFKVESVAGGMIGAIAESGGNIGAVIINKVTNMVKPASAAGAVKK